VAPEFYVYAADTANRGGSNTVTTACGSAPTAQCVQSYAQGAAQDAVAQLDAASIPVAPSTWWVDVECSTASCPDWQANRPDLNQAAVLGYVAGLKSRPDRVSNVGFYSTSYQWNHITGQTAGSPAFGVEGLPVWYASAASSPAAGASQYCGQTGFTGGAITLVQSAPITYAGSSSDIDPDVLCSPDIPPLITGVTQNALAGGLVTASGVGAPSTNLTLLLADSFTPQKPFANVLTNASGHWSQEFHLGSNGVLTVTDPAGETMSAAIVVIAKVNVSKTRTMGRDRLGHCIDRLDGSVYPYVAGTRAVLRGSQDKMVGFGKITKLGTIGSWNATIIVTCGKASTTKVTYSGLVPGSGVRFAGDGRTAAVKLPVNKTPAKHAR
jgi:hypothetical protein